MRNSEYNPILVTRKPPTGKRQENLEIVPPMDGLLGTGQFGTVSKALDRDLGREVAYKELKAEMNANDQIRERFVYEGQITAQLDHPNIVPIYELGRCPSADAEGEESMYLAMKRVRGRTLLEIVEERGPWPLSENELFSLLQSFLKICDDVGFANRRGVIHRDLKPDNIMIGDFGEVYVLDWGIAGTLAEMAKMTRGVDLMGTPAYMAPELAMGHHDEVDARTDIYGLGACLYEMLTGCAPHLFEGDSMEKTLTKAALGKIVPPAERVPFPLPSQLCKVVMKALSRNPGDRHGDATQLKGEIEKFLRTYSFFPKVTFEAGEMLFREGDDGDSVYIILDGQCEIFTTVGGKENHLRELQRGDVLGEIAVFTNKPRTASVRALSPVTAIKVTRKQILQDGELGYWISLFTKALAERFLEKERQIEALEKRLERFERLSKVPPR